MKFTSSCIMAGLSSSGSEMENDRIFWAVVIACTLVYAGYLAYSAGFFESLTAGMGKKEVSSNREDIDAFIRQNAVVRNTSLYINDKQAEFNKLQEELESMDLPHFGEEGGKKQSDKVMGVLRENQRNLAVLMELTRVEGQEIQALGLLGQRLQGGEREAAGRMVLNLQKHNYFKGAYFKEVAGMLNVTEENLRLLAAGRGDALVSVDYRSAREYGVMQEYHLREAEAAAEDFRARIG